MIAKQQMFDRIRGALGNKRTDVALPTPARFEIVDNGSLVDRFCRELSLVGGNAHRIAPDAKLETFVEKVLSVGESCSVALSDGCAIRDSGLREWLTNSGIEVLSTLSDSQTSQKDYVRKLLDARIGITQVDYAIAETGTLVLISGAEQHRLLSLVPPVHICLLHARQIVPTLGSVLTRLEQRFATGDITPRAVTMITGPSRTADIEHTLTMGVHGPVALHVLISETV
jgi:L-lactate dehydrogenase complex protein LldG